MNKKIYTILTMLVASIIILSVAVVSVVAENVAVSDAVITCAEEMRNEYHETIDDSEDEISPEYLTNNYESNLTYNNILEYMEANDNELRSHFSGAYVNADGYLVVALCCDTGNCISEIECNLAESEVIFEEGVGSYYYGNKKLDSVNEQIASLQESINNDEEVPETVRFLMQSMPRTIYNTDDNTISVVFNVDAEVEETVIKYEQAANETGDESVCVTLSDSEEQSLNLYNDLVNAFKENVNTSEDILYTVCTGYEQAEDQSVSWRPGRYIFVYTNPSAGSGSSISTGYRAKYSYKNNTYYGFVTCGHGTNVGNSVYISTNIASANKLGVILNKSYGNRIDVSFIKMTNSNYTNGQAVYYTSSQAGVTRQGIVLDGTQTTAALNSCIYKSGSTTYLTYGYVSSNTYSGYINNTYFYNLMLADRSMGAGGDSGAVTYVKNGSTVYGKAVGILKGKAGNNTVFVKASNITADFNATAY